MILIDHHYTQQYLTVLEFSSWNDCCCFDRSLLHSSMGLQGIVDKTREIEKFCRKRGEYDRTTLLSYLVGDIIDRIDQGHIKGGSQIYA